MGEVQSFTAEHADAVARIYLRAGRGQDRSPGKNLPDYISHLHLCNPWASPDIPSLVYLDKGKVVGALCILPRTMEFQGKPLRMATMTLYLVDPDHRNGPAGIQLLRRALKGPQDLSWTDGASGSVSALWTAMGGHTASPYAFNWVRILRPLGMARLGLDRMGRAGRLLKPVSALAIPADRLLSKVPLAILRAPVSPYGSKPVSTAELLECIQQLGWREALKPSYSSDTFPWLIDEAAQSKWGALRMLTVSNAEGERCGWCIYYAVPGGQAFVLQIGVRRKEDFRNVLLALFRDAWQQGSVCVKGAAIPQYLTAMTELHCFFRHPQDRVVVHSGNPDIASALRTGEAAITRLDGIGWMRFSRETWDQ
jgi:hypothetical protein